MPASRTVRRSAPVQHFHTNVPPPAQPAPTSTAESRINIAVGIAAIIVPLLVVVVGGFYTAGNITGSVKTQLDGLGKDVDVKLAPVARSVADVSTKVDLAAKDAQSKVDQLATQVDANNKVVQTKQDALSEAFKSNQAEQLSFRENVRNLFSKLSDQQQQLQNQIQQEKVDRLTSGKTK